MPSLSGDLGASILHKDVEEEEEEEEKEEEEEDMLEGGSGTGGGGGGGGRGGRGGGEQGRQGQHHQPTRWQRTLLFSIGAVLLLTGILALGATVSLHASEGAPRLASLAKSVLLASSSDAPPGVAVPHPSHAPPRSHAGSSSDAPPGAAVPPSSHAPPPSHGEEVFREVCMEGTVMFPNAGAVDQWIDIAPKIDAIKFVMNSIKKIPLPDLRAAVAKLNAKKILFDVEADGIRDGHCNSTKLAELNFNMVRKFYAAGGRLSLWTMHRPFSHGLNTARMMSCKYDSVDTTVKMIVGYARRITQLLEGEGYPPVVFGIDEAAAWYRVGRFATQPGSRGYGDLAQLIPKVATAFKQNKLELGFFHAVHPADLNWAGGGYAKLKELQMITRRAGLRFGKYFNNAKAGAIGDKVFYEATVVDRDQFVKAAGKPDVSVFESWWKHPASGFPSDTDYTLSWDVAHFFPKRRGRSKWAIQLERKLQQFEAQSKKKTG